MNSESIQNWKIGGFLLWKNIKVVVLLGTGRCHTRHNWRANCKNLYNTLLQVATCKRFCLVAKVPSTTFATKWWRKQRRRIHTSKGWRTLAKAKVAPCKATWSKAKPSTSVLTKALLFRLLLSRKWSIRPNTLQARRATYNATWQWWMQATFAFSTFARATLWRKAKKLLPKAERQLRTPMPSSVAKLYSTLRKTRFGTIVWQNGANCIEKLWVVVV